MILHSRSIRLAACIAGTLAITLPATAQNGGRPAPAPATTRDLNAQPVQDTGDVDVVTGRDPNGGQVRRPIDGGQVILAFDDVSIEQTIPFIVESTGKVVMPLNLSILRSRKITLMNDKPIDREIALDLLFKAFRLSGIGVIETDDIVVLDSIENFANIPEVIFLDATDPVEGRTDTSNIVIKVFALEHASAEEVADQLEPHKPDYATVTAAPTTNQIIVRGDVELCQRFQLLINELDKKIKSTQMTFRLRHADASQISDNILDLYEGTSTQPGAQNRNPQQQQGGRNQGSRPRTTGGSTTAELRVTVNSLQNSVTVRGEPPIVEEIALLIEAEWDLPRAPGTARFYALQNSDPIVMRDKLQEVLGDGSAAPGGGGQRRAGAGGNAASVTDIVGGVYKIEALPDTNGLLVIGKTEAVFEFFDQLIAQIDQPSTVGVPTVVPLKHADAVQLAEELNALLAESGAQVSIPRPPTGLTGGGIQGLDDSGGAAPAGGDAAGQITFPWQRAGGPNQERSEASSLIGRVRLVPIIRRNALAVLAPPAQRLAMMDLIEAFDLPGRQVRLAAIIAEVELSDDLSLGVRFSNGDISSPLTDNRIGGTTSFEGIVDDVLDGIFDTGVLTSGMSANIVLQALAQKTNVRIVQQPTVFTADNQEAAFFDGQDVPLQDGSTTTAEGFVTENVDRRAVGVILNIRPRITAQRDVDLAIRLQISSIVQGQTIAGRQIVDRRETSSHIIVANEQTVVISGILRDEETLITRKVPGFGDIPLLGELFTSRDNAVRTTELLAFVTPSVVDGLDEADALNADYIERVQPMLEPIKGRDLSDRQEEVRRRIEIPRPEPMDRDGLQ